MTDAVSGLVTETVDARFRGIDRMSVAELAATMNAADAEVPAAVARALPQIAPAIEAASERMSRGGRLLYVGAGTPGRIGVLDASECPPTFGTPPSLVIGIIAGGPAAIVHPAEGAEDDEIDGAAAMDEAEVTANDSVVGIAASGRTPWVLAAVRRARELGALTVGLSCNLDTPLSAVAEHPIEVAVGPEVLAGSTRLKAGTAQKLVLNMFSTIVMVQQGKTYGNLMVDLNPSNHKLRERAIGMVSAIAAVDRSVAAATLESVDFHVKTAAVVLRLGLERDAAERRLAEAGGRLRAALGE